MKDKVEGGKGRPADLQTMLLIWQLGKERGKEDCVERVWGSKVVLIRFGQGLWELHDLRSHTRRVSYPAGMALVPPLFSDTWDKHDLSMWEMQGMRAGVIRPHANCSRRCGGTFLPGYNGRDANRGSIVCERLYVYVLCVLIGMWLKWRSPLL